MKKTCTRCKIDKDLSEFSPRRTGKMGLNSQCKECRAEVARKYRNTNAERYLENNRKWRQDNPGKYSKRSRGYVFKRYGITEQEYDEMFTRQNGCCAVCGERPEGALHIDHNHDTNRVRGLLCQKCNTSIGLVKENTNILTRMISYLGGQK